MGAYGFLEFDYLRITVNHSLMATDTSDLELETLDEETMDPPESRIKDAKAARSAFMKLQIADRPRSLHRARHQALLDGEPPYDQAQLAAKGMGTRTNVNWGDTEAISSTAISGAVDFNVSVERLIRAPIHKLAVEDDEERTHYETILADELTKTIRDWEDYDRSYLTLAHYTFNHGVGVAYFDDQFDWRFQVSGLSDLLIPDETMASENKIPIVTCYRKMEVYELYEKIKNEEVAVNMGWNVPAVKKAIQEACPDTELSQNWMSLQQAMRNNSLGMGLGGKTSKVGVIHVWVPEFDGTVSKYILTHNPLKDYGDNEPWLFQQKGIYPEMRRGMIFFTYGIGNGTYHSIPGLLRKIYPQALALNRTQSNMLDAANFATSMLIQPISENYMSRMRITNLGTISIAPAEEHGKIIEMNRPNVAQSAIPVVADLRDVMAKRA